MTFEQFNSGKGLTLTLDARLSAVTAEELEKELQTRLKGIEDFVVDMSRLTYVSSAGLRVLLKAQKAMNIQGKMTIKNAADPTIMNVFQTTGFNEILQIEKQLLPPLVQGRCLEEAERSTSSTSLSTKVDISPL